MVPENKCKIEIVGQSIHCNARGAHADEDSVIIFSCFFLFITYKCPECSVKHLAAQSRKGRKVLFFKLNLSFISIPMCFYSWPDTAFPKHEASQLGDISPLGHIYTKHRSYEPEVQLYLRVYIPSIPTAVCARSLLYRIVPACGKFAA